MAGMRTIIRRLKQGMRDYSSQAATPNEVRSANVGSRLRATNELRAYKKYLKIEHDSVPKDSKLVQKLGLKSGETAHFFATFSGEWAKALAEGGVSVHATDIDRKVLGLLEKNKGTLREVRRQVAQYGAITPNYYDWHVSYEPFPIFNNAHGVEDVARQALINKRGLVVVYGLLVSFLNHEIKNHTLRLEGISKIYGAEFVEKNVSIKSNVMPCRARILRLKTNPEARRKAELELYVERRKHSWKGGRRGLVAKLASEFEKTENEIRESLERIRLTEKLGLLALHE